MITLADIEAAQIQLDGLILRTPLMKSPVLSERLNTNVYLKLELFQITGSFKPRGAFVQILNREAEAREKGVVAVSGGNFAVAVAFCAQKLGIDATICMPDYTPANYVNATKAFGANVELLPDVAKAFARADDLGNSGLVLLHPFDNPGQMAGVGSVGLEIVDDAPQMTDVIISVGGGGLIGGTSVAIKAQKPDVNIWAVETAGAQTMNEALKAGKVVTVMPDTLAKTLAPPYVAADALAIVQKHVKDLIVVTDDEAIASQRVLLEQAKIFTELAASCVLSAADKIQAQFTPDSHVVLLMCGGNESAIDMVARW